MTVSIVVPTYNERDNVGELIRRLDATLTPPAGAPGENAEIVVVDDSSDDTPEQALSAAREVSIPVRVLHRSPEERAGGLGGAVMLGLRAARGDWAVVMDGDLQHPPETVPALLAARHRELLTPDVVVASRYTGDGSAAGLDGGWRRFGSSGAGGLAKLLFPRALRQCTDPMSGFFAVRLAALRELDLRPDGFKILLEILARGRMRVAEVPFSFGERHAGDSKAGARQALVYLRHLLRLRASGTPGRLAGFLAVGASGLVPNLGAMVALQRAGMHYLPATVIATLLAITWNFVLSDWFIFRSRRSGPVGSRYAGYLGLNLLDVVARVPMMGVLVGLLTMPVLLATLTCTAVISAARFAALDRFLYRRVPRLPAVPVPVPAQASPAGAPPASLDAVGEAA